ncbi:MAG: hypothetical protein GX942_05425 [Papillibacter sp.]|nr:hypothetical protein [Papillibacter sp.]
MPKEARHYFVYGNTAQGFVSKLTTNLRGTEELFILQGLPGTGKAGFMELIADECQKAGLIPEYLHCPSCPDACDGLIIPALKLAVLDGTDLHFSGLNASDYSVRYIDTGPAFNSERLRQADNTIAELIQYINKSHDSALSCFRAALKIHDEWEKIYISNMDFTKADLLASSVTDMILGHKRLPKSSVIKERFFGASTPYGSMDFIESLTADISKRYLLKGRPGTGKSSLLRKLTAASVERGLDAEVYFCAFDSNSLDMLIWPELDVCLFDSTAPHLYEPSRQNDEVIDMYAACVKPGTDEKYEAEIADISKRYKAAVQEGVGFISKAKEALDKLLEIYSAASDPTEIKRICAAVTEKLAV